MPAIAIHTLGTRGDVQPYVALGRGLLRAGFDVTVATAPGFRDVVTRHGLRFAPLPGDILEQMRTPEGGAALAGRRKLPATLRLLRLAREGARDLLNAQWAATRSADAVVFHPKAFGGASIAERLGVPAFAALPLPGLSPTRAFSSPMLGGRDLGPLNRLTHLLMLGYGDLAFRGPLRRWRAEVLGLPPGSSPLSREGRPVPKLYAYSEAVVPTPPDWDTTSHVTGYWFLDEATDWTPPPDLVRFLEAGPPPVYVGFGSMPPADAESRTGIVLDALSRAGLRGVLASGWGGLRGVVARADVHVLDEAPHDWLFPRMAAVVHHGGAGTTAAGLRAGCPTVICPFFGDQPFWGRRVRALGAGPKPIPQSRLAAEPLAAAMVEAVHDAAMRAAARRLAGAIAREDGVGHAVDVIARTIPAGPT